MTITDFHAKYLANGLTRRQAGGDADRLAVAVASAQVDLNPHQVAAFGIAANPAAPKPAWAIFRNQNDSIELLAKLMMADYGVADDAATAAKRAQRPVRLVRGRAVDAYDYPQPLFDYLSTRAPQIAIPA